MSPAVHQLLLDAEKCTEKCRAKPQALILSVDKYESPAMQGHPVESNADSLDRALLQLGWDPKRERNLGLEETRKAIHEFAAEVARSGAACLLAFIGHGIKTGGDIFLLPSDATGCEGGLRLAEVQEMFAGRGGDASKESGLMVFLLDCTRSVLPCSVSQVVAGGGAAR